GSARVLRRPPAAPARHRGDDRQSAVRAVLPRPGGLRRCRRGRRPSRGRAGGAEPLADYLLVRPGRDAAAGRGRAHDAALRRRGHAPARVGYAPAAPWRRTSLVTWLTPISAR